MPVQQIEASKKLKVTNKKSIVLVEKKKHKIKTNVKATFKSSNKKIAVVTNKGVITAKKSGKVKITVTSKRNKKQKVVVKVTVKKRTVASANNSVTATETTTATPTESLTETSTETSTETPIATSISATYSGGIMPTYSSLDFTKLKVIAYFNNGTTKELSMVDYKLSTNYSKTEGDFSIQVTYNDLTTFFNITCKKINSEDYDYIKFITYEYTGNTYPIDSSLLTVYIDTLHKHYKSENPNFEYCGITTRKGIKCHQYLIYHTEDFIIDNTPIHNFEYDLLMIPVN